MSRGRRTRKQWAFDATRGCTAGISQPHRRRLRFEPLEDRRLLATITVNTILDQNDGVGVGGISLRDAIAAVAPNDTINFDASLTSSGPATIQLLNIGGAQLTIDKNLTIEGPGADLLTINAFDPTPANNNGDGSRVFNVDDGNPSIAVQRSVSINGLTLTGGDVNGNGGAVRNLESLTLSASVVTGNVASFSGGGNGGGLYNGGLSVLVLNGVTVSNNLSGFGGGIDNQAGSLSVANSTISGNVVTGNGGGIQNNFGTLNVTNSTISDNNGNAAGGGILSYFDVATNVTATTIRGNIAGLGAGIWSRESTVTFNGSTISGNSATGNGGGIYQLNDTLTVNTSTIHHNTASNSGAGIFSMGGTANVQNSMVSHNTATVNAGGIEERNGTLNVTNSTVQFNRSSQYGGGIWSYSSASIITGSTINGNIALYSNVTAGSGGGILQTYGSLSVQSSTISGNASSGSGGGIFTYYGTLTVAHSTIALNLANGSDFDPFSFGVGGGIHVVGSSVVLDHTIVAQNFHDPPGVPPEDDVNGPVAARFSLIGSNLGASITNNGGNQIGTNASPIDPLFGFSLADKGGQATLRLLPGSPALDAGDPAAVAGVGSVPLNDQRGAPFGRIVDGNGIPGARIDIGAFEQQTVPGLNFVVDILVDEMDGDYSAGDLSLREAIGLANGSGNVGLETITFDPALTSGGPAKILLTRGQLEINESVTIAGPGAELLTIDASGNDPTPSMKSGDGSRVLSISNFNYATFIDVEINNLTITGGDFGGGVYTAENLSLQATTITGNGGGGIRQNRGVLTVTDSTISGNSGAGGIYSFSATAIIERSTITGNSSTGEGGGVSNHYGNLAVSNSTISGNSAEDGGGIFSATNLIGTQTTTIVHSTISGNTASGDDDGSEGGGIYNENGLIIIRFSTITNNTAAAGYGSGILGKANDLTRTEVYSTIIAGNTNSDVDVLEGAVNSFQSNGYNLIGTGSAIADFNQPGDQTGVLNPMLDSLADNGGPTMTHALQPGSPAIDTGSAAAVPGFAGVPLHDQRGVPHTRVFDGDGTMGAQIDIGAHEIQPPIVLPASLIVDTLADEDDGDFSSGDLSLREAVRLANSLPAIGPITFAPSLTSGGPARILLSLGQIFVYESMTITGPGAKWMTIDANDPTPEDKNGDGSRIFNIDNGNIFANAEVELMGLTLTGGDVAGIGGAILAREDVSILRSAVSGNAATTGGGIYSFGGNLTITASTISGNSANNGGGIYSKSVFLTVDNSTISGNTAKVFGGGISTPYGSVRLAHSTITGNVADADENNSGHGGGIAVFNNPYYASVNVELDHTIVAGNIRGASTRSDIFGPIGDAEFSLIGDNTGATVFNDGSNLIGTTASPIDPMLDSLADNGGPTMTHALQPGSPVIDAGDAAILPSPGEFDQRGAPFTRVFDGDAVPGARTDIGAAERQPIPPAVFGDYNNDGVIDAADYVMWRKLFGMTGVPAYSGADGNGDTTIDQDDYGVWRPNFGMTVPAPGAGSAAVVPEFSASAIQIREPAELLPTETTAAPAETDVTAARAAGFALLDNPSRGQDSGSRSRGRIQRYKFAESRSEDLLLLATDRVEQASPQDVAVVDDRGSDDVHADDEENQWLNDESLTVALAEWRSAWGDTGVVRR